VEDTVRYLAVAVGAVLGANLRFIIRNWATDRWGPDFPYGTFIINVSGAFVIGLFLALLGARSSVNPLWRLFFATGFLGGYTTFTGRVDPGDRGNVLQVLMGRGRPPAAAKAIARDVMHSPAISVERNASIELAARRMVEARLKVLPVTDEDGRLLGAVDRSDLLAQRATRLPY
jgi:CBS domain-containing protein